MARHHVWTDEQLMLLPSLWLRGYSVPHIANHLGLAPHQVKYKVYCVGLHKRSKEYKPGRKPVLSKQYDFERWFFARGYRAHVEVADAGQTDDTPIIDFLKAAGVPESEHEGLVERFRIEIARVMRPKWLDRSSHGDEFARLTAPMFLKRVHFEEINDDGTVDVETIKAIDPELIRAVAGYISQRKHRGLDFGDANDLKFYSRPKPLKQHRI